MSTLASKVRPRGYVVTRQTLGTILGIASGILFLPIEIKVGVVLRPFDFFLGFVLLLSPFFLLKKSLLRDFFSRSYIQIYVLLCLYLTLNAVVLNPSATTKEALQQFEFFIFTFLMVGVFVQPQARRAFFRAYFYTTFALVIYTTVWHIAHGYVVMYKALDELKILYGLLATFLFVRFALDRKYLLLFLFAALLMVMSLERKGWFAFILTAGPILLILYRSFRYRQRVLRIVSRVAIGVSLLGFILVSGSVAQSDEVLEQFNDTAILFTDFSLEKKDAEEIGSQSNAGRLYLMLISLNAIRENPIFGIGTDRFRQEITLISARMGDEKTAGAHNEYQRLAVENGLPALFVYLLMLWLAYRSIRRIPPALVKQDGSVLDYTLVVAFFIYGGVVNFFLGGGATNKFFLTLPLGMVGGMVIYYQQRYGHKLKINRPV
ncbi:MAG: O-antigen ligase family protein [Bacteroidota bacterium]